MVSPPFLILIFLDGFGCRKDREWNATAQVDVEGELVSLLVEVHVHEATRRGVRKSIPQTIADAWAGVEERGPLVVPVLVIGYHRTGREKPNRQDNYRSS